MRYFGEGISNDYNLAYDFFKKSINAADMGITHLYLGKCLINGYGVERDLNLGYKELKTALSMGIIDDENLIDMLSVDMDGNVGFKN